MERDLELKKSNFMKINKAKLIKGTYLDVIFTDNTAIVSKSYPHTEAPPKLVKAFQKLNNHLTDLTEQYDSKGLPDYDMIAARGYSIKGEGEKEGVTITGVRTLATGKSITLNSPFMSMDIQESEYPNMKQLVACLESCRNEIMTFMENNKSQDEIQGKLFDSKTVILSPEKTAEQMTADALSGKEVDVTDLYKKGNKGKEKPLASDMQKMVKSADELYPQGYSVIQNNEGNPDVIVPITEEMRQNFVAQNAAKNKRKK